MDLRNLNSKEGLKFGIGVLASIVMFFTPDHIDRVIELVLPTVLGVDLFKLEKK